MHADELAVDVGEEQLRVWRGVPIGLDEQDGRVMVVLDFRAVGGPLQVVSLRPETTYTLAMALLRMRRRAQRRAVAT